MSAYKFNFVHNDGSFIFRVTAWSRILLEKLIVAQLAMKLPALYGT
jgi:hypothetical protein